MVVSKDGSNLMKTHNGG